MPNDVMDKMTQHEYNNNKYYTTSAFRYIYIYIYVNRSVFLVIYYLCVFTID